MSLAFADRLSQIQTSAIRELFKLLGRPGIISFAGGFPDSALFDVEGMRVAAENALSKEPSAALQYGATEGYMPLREQLSALMDRKGVVVSPEGLIVTTGSQQALDLIGKTMVSPGDRVIVESPTFLAAIQCFKLYGAEVISAPINADGICIDALELLLQQHRPRFVYVVPSFGNPSGALMPLERRLALLRLAVRYQTLIVEDDPYGDLYFDQSPPPSMLALSVDVPESREWVAYCGSLSKTLSPGLRVGWMVAQPELLAKAVMCKQFSDAHTSTFAQATAAQYLRAGRLLGMLDTMRNVYAERCATMADSLKVEFGDRLQFVRPAGGLFIWARLHPGTSGCTDAAVLARHAIEHGAAFVPGAPFFANTADHASLRLSFATADNDLIRTGISRIARALEAADADQAQTAAV